MDPQLIQVLTTLRSGRAALQSELQVWSEAGVFDKARLKHLREAARSFQEQAHSLLVMMVYQEVPEALRQEAEDLVSYFSGAVTAIEAMRAPDK